MTALGPTESELSLRLVVDALPRAIVVSDPHGRIAMWSSQATALYGWDEADVLGLDASTVLCPAGPGGSLAEVLARVAAGETFVGDLSVCRHGGHPIQVHLVARPVYDDAGSVAWVVSASEDLTAAREVEQAHTDLANRLMLALDAAGLGTWQWNMASGEVRWDRRMEELFGFEPGEFDGTFDAYRAALHPADRDEVLATVRAAMESKSRYTLEHRVMGPDGSTRWIHGAGLVTTDADGEVTGAIGCSMDITDRVEARLALERAAASAETAADVERIARERFEFLAAINSALADARTTEEIMTGVTRAAVPRLGDWCSIYVSTEDRHRPLVETYHVDPAMVEMARELTVRYPFDPDAHGGMAAVIRTGEAEFVPEITADVVDEALASSRYSDDDAEELRDLLGRLSLRSAISVPLRKHGRVLGGVSFVSTTGRRRFTDDDLGLATIVADRVAASLENRRLTDQQRMIASILQDSLLPHRLPTVAGLDVAVRYWSANEGTDVGGDFYDLFEIDDGSWAAVIGDVCGTGPDAAALTATARHAIRSGAWHGDTSLEILHWLNHAVRSSISPGASFLTAAYLRVNRTEDGFSVETTNAGHPPPVLVRTDGSSSLLGHPGRLIGVFDTIRATPTSSTLRPGEVIVLYTDGLTDVPPPHDLTAEQAATLIAECCAEATSAGDVADHLEQRITERLRLHRRPDDIALLVLRAM